MKTHNINLESEIDLKSIALAIGNFDGIHLGHKSVIERLTHLSVSNNYQPSILSFDPHPRIYFSKEDKNFQIITNEEKINLLNKLGVVNYFSLQFDKEIASLAPLEFIKKILIDKLHIKYLIVGYDFKFGKDRKGDVNLLKEQSDSHGFKIDVIEQKHSKINSEIYSSSYIRKFITEGDIEKANLFLGRNWSMKGVVIEGDKRAREINFPTANIVPPKIIHPKKGVYAVKTNYNNICFNGIANFGERPTVDGKKLLLEVHLFNFDKNIYGKELTVEFLAFIREEKKFDNFDLLTKQIQKDIKIVKTYYSKK